MLKQPDGPATRTPSPAPFDGGLSPQVTGGENGLKAGLLKEKGSHPEGDCLVCSVRAYLLENWGARRAALRRRGLHIPRFRPQAGSSPIPPLLLSPQNLVLRGPLKENGLKAGLLKEKGSHPKGDCLVCSVRVIISWRTGERDGRPSDRTSFFPSFWGRGSGNRRPSGWHGIRGSRPAGHGRCRDGWRRPDR